MRRAVADGCTAMLLVDVEVQAVVLGHVPDVGGRRRGARRVRMSLLLPLLPSCLRPLAAPPPRIHPILALLQCRRGHHVAISHERRVCIVDGVDTEEARRTGGLGGGYGDGGGGD